MADQQSVKWSGHLFFALGIVIALVHIWMNTLGTLSSLWQNSIHYASFVVLAALAYPRFSLQHKDPVNPWISLAVATLAAIAILWLVFQEDAIYQRGVRMSWLEMAAACFVIIVIIEFTRRATGWVIPSLIVIALSYVTWLGPLVGGVLRFSGLGFETVLFRSIYGDDALLGSIAGISSSFVFMFILFGAFLLRSGAGDFIIELSQCIAARLTGGPGFVAIFSSALTGMISGSAVANTASTGVITIPLMKKSGFDAKFAAGVEAASSTGGQLMPPIMGAGAFVMASFTQLPYSRIVIYSIIPALLYFATIGFFVYLEAKKRGLQPARNSQKTAWQLIKQQGWAYLLPIVILIVLLIKGYTPTYTAGVAMLALVAFSWFTPHKMTFRRILDALALGSKNMVFTAVIMLAVGLIVNAIITTGIGNTFSLMIADWSNNNMLIAFVLIALASLIIGMGLPVTASYIVLGTLSAPVLYKLLTDQYLIDAIMSGEVTDSLKAFVILSAPDLVDKLGQSISHADAGKILAAIPADFLTPVREEMLSAGLLASSLLAAHLVIFWLSQDSNVTPPVCLVAFTAAAIAGTRPMETGLQAWKMAKGLYIIPLLFLYGPMVTGEWWEIIASSLFALLGLFAFTAMFEGFFISRLRIPERIYLAISAFLLLWPLHWGWNIAGLVMFVLMLLWLLRRGHACRDDAIQQS